MDKLGFKSAPEKVRRFVGHLNERGETFPDQIMWAKDVFERFDIGSFEELVAFRQALADLHIDFNKVVTPLTMSQLVDLKMNTVSGINRLLRAGFKLEIFRGDLSRGLARTPNHRLRALANAAD